MRSTLFSPEFRPYVRFCFLSKALAGMSIKENRRKLCTQYQHSVKIQSVSVGKWISEGNWNRRRRPGRRSLDGLVLIDWIWWVLKNRPH